MSELQVTDMLKEPMSLGAVFAESGMFPDIKTQSQGVVKILAGKELGLSAFQSVKSLYFVNGRLALASDAMASLVKASPKYDYKVDTITDTECAISFFNGTPEDRKLIGTSTFTFKDAAKAGLANKDNWKNYPRNMLFARALANGCRWYCPDAICGYHTVEEMQDIEPVKVEAPKKTVEITVESEVTSGDSNNQESPAI